HYKMERTTLDLSSRCGPRSSGPHDPHSARRRCTRTESSRPWLGARTSSVTTVEAAPPGSPLSAARESQQDPGLRDRSISSSISFNRHFRDERGPSTFSSSSILTLITLSSGVLLHRFDRRGWACRWPYEEASQAHSAAADRIAGSRPALGDSSTIRVEDATE